MLRHMLDVSANHQELPLASDRAVLSDQGSAKEVPKLFNPAEEYDDKSVLLVTLSQKTITLTAKEVTGMPWPQFVRLMKVRADSSVLSVQAHIEPLLLCGLPSFTGPDVRQRSQSLWDTYSMSCCSCLCFSP